MESKFPPHFSLLALVCLLLVPNVDGQTAPTFTTLHRFTGVSGEGSDPQAALIQGSDGAFYGTTNSGGTSGKGTVYRLSADAQTLTTLHSFTGTGGEGSDPDTALLQGKDGAFYGATAGGGANGAGTIYRLSADGTMFATFYSFAGSASVAAAPNALIQGSDGAFYGTTVGGGTNNIGTIFRLSADGKTFTTLYNFTGVNGTGNLPEAALLQGSDGAFYGTTQGESDAPNNGVVYRLSVDGKTFTVLHAFSGTDNYAFPEAAVILGTDGAFYGTTLGGGTSGKGTVYRLSADGKMFASLHSFTGASGDGANPYGTLLQGSDGTFYGTTNAGGTGGYGAIYQLSSDGKTLTTIHSFTGPTGDSLHPQSTLLKGSDGNLYGTTAGGSGGDQGSIYELILPKVTPLTARSITRTATAVTVVYSGTPGATYQPQYTGTLTSNQWTNAGPLLTADSSGRFTYTDATQPQPPARFYRAVSSP